TNLIGWLSGAKGRAGFAGYGRGMLLTKQLREPTERGRRIPRSAIDHFLDIVAALGAPVHDREMELTLTPMERAAADTVWREHRLHDANHVVALNTGGAYGAAKCWPAEHF